MSKKMIFSGLLPLAVIMMSLIILRTTAVMIAWYGCGKEADSGYGLRVAGYGLQVASFGLRVAGYELRDKCADGGLFDV